jgi:hypothetical protein
MERGRMADPAALPPGTQVGSWRIMGQQGSGSYGVVYRVERVGQEGAGPFALKVARRLLDPRFEREWVLLSRIRHAHVPRFEVQGWVTLPGGVPYPYVVMEWVEGTPLYEWGAREPRTSRQVMRVLAQVARALEATHAVEGVHRAGASGDTGEAEPGTGSADCPGARERAHGAGHRGTGGPGARARGGHRRLPGRSAHHTGIRTGASPERSSAACAGPCRDQASARASPPRPRVVVVASVGHGIASGARRLVDCAIAFRGRVSSSDD